MPQENKREAGFELLRIIAMLMIITLHYLSKGGAMQKMTVQSDLYTGVLWLLESFCIVSVNVYVLISGYFLVESRWRPGKILSVIAEVLFYSILVPVVLMLLGVVDLSGWTMYDWMNVILPLETEHYWFATSYVILYVLAPVLATAAKYMPKKQLQITIGLLVIFFSLTKSVNPLLLTTDQYGYDFGWFICLFLIAAYIRLYGTVFLNNVKKCFLVYTVFSVLGFCLSAVSAFIWHKTGQLEYYMDMPYCYNHLFVLIASVALFCMAIHIHIPEGKAASLICRIAPYTFGVYLLHENIVLRDIWPKWLQIERVIDTPWIFLHLLASVLIVFLIGIMVDAFRALLFRKFQRKVNRPV